MELQNKPFKMRELNQEIENILLENTDFLTGEISDEAVKLIEELEIAKEQIIHEVALLAIDSASESKTVDAEIKRLQSIKKARVSRANFAKRLVESMVIEGEKMRFDNLEISWRKSKVVHVSSEINLEKLSKDHPDLVKTSYNLDKMLCKKMQVLPEGIEIQEKLNIQIK